MPPLPTPEEIAAALRMPGSRPPRDGSGAYASDEEQIADDEAPFVRRDSGNVADKAKVRLRMLTEATNANAYIHARLLGIRPRYQSDPDYSTITQRYQDESNRIIENGLSLVSDDRLRKRVRADVAAPLAQERTAVRDQAFRSAADAHATNREDYLQGLVQNLTLNPKDAVTAGGIDAFHAMLDNAVDHGFLTREAASIEKRRAALALCVGEYAAMARRDPERAIRELEAQEDGHPLLAHLPQEQKDSLIRQARDQQENNSKDAQHAAIRTQQDAQRASDHAENEIVDDLTSAKPTLTRNDISDNLHLSPAAKAYMLAVADRGTKPDPDAAISNSTARQLLDRVRLADRDPARMANLNPLYDAYIGEKLGKNDFDFVRKEFSKRGSPESNDLLIRKQAFFKKIEHLIDQSEPASDQVDHIGKAQMYRFERDAARKIEQYHKDGKDPFDLFDPAKSDYVGSIDALKSYIFESLRQHLYAHAHQMRSITADSTGDTTLPQSRH